MYLPGVGDLQLRHARTHGARARNELVEVGEEARELVGRHEELVVDDGLAEQLPDNLEVPQIALLRLDELVDKLLPLRLLLVQLGCDALVLDIRRPRAGHERRVLG
jgi:hypothetical protein